MFIYEDWWRRVVDKSDELYNILNEHYAYIICSTLKIRGIDTPDGIYIWDGFEEYKEKYDNRIN